MNAWIGWTLAVLAVALGYLQWGWRGVLLALTVIVFWLLLQFRKVLRVMRAAGAAPVGQVPNAVMLHSRLRPGMRLTDILPLTRSLGRKVSDETGTTPEAFEWADGAGDRVTVELRRGRLVRSTLTRAG